LTGGGSEKKGVVRGGGVEMRVPDGGRRVWRDKK